MYYGTNEKSPEINHHTNTDSRLLEKLGSEAKKGIALIVDDEEGSATGMRMMLEREGYGAIVQNNFAGAARYIAREGRKRHSELVMAFVDFELPDGDGSEITAMIKETLLIPVISISGFAYSQQYFLDPMKRADLTSPKPISLSALRRAISDAERIYNDRFEFNKAA